MIYINEILRKARVLFVIDFCDNCNIWKKFVERINSELKYNNRIKVINSTFYNEYGRPTHSLHTIFDSYIDAFPILFFEGARLDGTHTRIEAEAWLRSRVHNDFLVKRNNQFLFEKKCKYRDRGFFKRRILECSD